MVFPPNAQGAQKGRVTRRRAATSPPTSTPPSRNERQLPLQILERRVILALGQSFVRVLHSSDDRAPDPLAFERDHRRGRHPLPAEGELTAADRVRALLAIRLPPQLAVRRLAVLLGEELVEPEAPLQHLVALQAFRLEVHLHLTQQPGVEGELDLRRLAREADLGHFEIAAGGAAGGRRRGEPLHVRRAHAPARLLKPLAFAQLRVGTGRGVPIRTGRLLWWGGGRGAPSRPRRRGGGGAAPPPPG